MLFRSRRICSDRDGARNRVISPGDLRDRAVTSAGDPHALASNHDPPRAGPNWDQGSHRPVGSGHARDLIRTIEAHPKIAPVKGDFERGRADGKCSCDGVRVWIHAGQGVRGRVGNPYRRAIEGKPMRTSTYRHLSQVDPGEWVDLHDRGGRETGYP